MNNSITFVSFYGSSLATVKVKNTVYVCMKSVINGIGLDWSTQHRKLRGCYQKYGCGFLSIPGKNGTKKILVTPLKKLTNWLQSINPKKVKDSVKELVLVYQRECAEAIQAHWRKPRTVKKPRYADVADKNGCTGLLPNQISIIKALHRQLVLAVAKEKQAELAMTLWQAVQARYGVSYEKVPSSKFVDVICLLSRVAVKKASICNLESDKDCSDKLNVPSTVLVSLYESFACSQKMRLMYEHLFPTFRILGSKYEAQIHEFAYEMDRIFNKCHKAFLPLFEKMPESEAKESARNYLAKLM
ncbi:phage antirepressor N-terminal domain-containing protein [Snodgrassella gandavensis]|uniref:phage antirepressor N-terminal domain-containing protein n=1 Tax=Snodgrassella gandavensis TaxID=2946698 RepID=UPI001EF55723|nr:phage antirepressor N-terminal domain-containing protein [Snodgrassella gandavensis]